MAQCSPEIRPLAPVHVGPGIAPAKTFTFEDNSTTIYPKLPNGHSCRVVIIRRSVTSNHGSVFNVCRNAGKWSYRIDYAMQSKTTRMTKERFIAEVTRMGGANTLHLLLAAA